MHDIEDAQREVVFLDVLPSIVGDQRQAIDDVLLVHGDGELRCRTGDLQTERWRCSKRTSVVHDDVDDEECHVEYASMIDVETGQKGLLQGRGDALASLDARLRTETNSPRPIVLLLLLSRPAPERLTEERGRTLHVLTIKLDPDATATRYDGTVQPLCRFRLAEANQARLELSTTSVHASSGTLQYLFDGALFTYDLTGAHPRLVSRLTAPRGPFVSFLRWSSTQVLTATRSCVESYDLRYRSIQFTTTLPAATPRSSSPTKRKWTTTTTVDEDPQASIDLLAFFPRSDLLVGRRGGQLVGIGRLASAVDHGRPRRVRSGTLLDALGRGIPDGVDEEEEKEKASSVPPRIHVLGDHLNDSTTLSDHQTWPRIRVKMERCARRADVEAFEKAFAQEVGIERDETSIQAWRSRKDRWEQDQRHDKHHMNGTRLSNGVSSPKSKRKPKFSEAKPVPAWNWPSEDGRAVSWMKLQEIDGPIWSFVLRTIFSIHRPDPRRRDDRDDDDEGPAYVLRMGFCPPNVIRWLACSGILTVSNLRAALQQQPELDRSASAAITAEAIVEQILASDVATDLLSPIVQGPVFLEAEEFMRAAKALIPHVTRPDIDQGRASSVGTPAAWLARQPWKDGRQGQRLWSERKQPDTVDRIEEALIIVLTRLHRFPSPQVSRLFKRVLAREELLDVIQLLRRLMASDGWTSWYLDEDITADGGHESGSEDVSTLSDLLSCAIDSMGAAAWLNASPNPSTIADPLDLIVGLQADISAALGVAEEATYLRGLLHELLYYAKSDVDPDRNGPTQPSSAVGVMAVRPRSNVASILPIGSNPHSLISRTKTLASGETHRRTRRDMAKQEYMRVGSYTMERIII